MCSGCKCLCMCVQMILKKILSHLIINEDCIHETGKITFFSLYCLSLHLFFLFTIILFNTRIPGDFIVNKLWPAELFLCSHLPFTRPFDLLFGYYLYYLVVFTENCVIFQRNKLIKRGWESKIISCGLTGIWNIITPWSFSKNYCDLWSVSNWFFFPVDVTFFFKHFISFIF